MLKHLGYKTFYLLSAIVIGCSSGKRAEPREVPAPALESAIQDTQNEELYDRTQWIPQDWWTLFQDEQLSAFIQKALINNPTLQQAQAKILSAAYAADQARSSLFPLLTWGGDVAREKLSETGLIPFSPTGPTPQASAIPAAGGVAGIPVYFTLFETELNLSYDFDIWGKNRNIWKAAIGELYANMADEAFSRLQLSIAIAQVYYQLQIDYRRLEIGKALVVNQEKYSSLIQKRIKNNLNNDETLHTSKTNVSNAKQALLPIEGDIAVKENQLRAYMADDFDENIDRIQISENPLPKVPLPYDLPLHLIGNRPDIIARLWLIESAGKQIKAAKAGFYPDFNLISFFGYQTIHLHELFKWPSSFFNVDPAFNLPIFDGWRLLANLRSSEINYDLAILQYNEGVINAVKEVIESLAILNNQQQQVEEYQRKLEEQVQLLNLSQLRLNWNLNSELDYLTTEQNLFAAQDQEVVALGNKYQAILSLIKALGGGYQSCD